MYLQANGCTLVEGNYRCRAGEIDLVVWDGDTLVFAEVRYRSHRGFGGAAASVDARKVRRLIRTASHYLQARRIDQAIPCRFDVLALGRGEQIEWIRGAFEVESWT